MAEPVELRIPFATLVKVAFFALLVAIIVKLWGVILMLVIAALLAVMLDPFVVWLNDHGWKRGLAIALVGFLLFAITAGFFFAVIPSTTGEVRQLVGQIPRLSAIVGEKLPQLKPLLNQLNGYTKQPVTEAQLRQWLTRGALAGRFAVEGLTAVTLIFVVTIYLLIEGRRVLEWLVAFFHGKTRDKVRRTLAEVQPIVFAYMRGQAITCFLCGGVAITTLSLLHVPAAMPLAVLAFFADLVPVVGTILMTIPAVALALTVGPMQAAVVLLVYLAYHLVESYVIIPRVYGAEMKLSTLTVLLAVVVGGTLQGALGAVLVLPFVAAYPVVERVWLARQLGGTVAEHEAIEERNEP